jgi:plasmid stabilization system protein ParE
VAYRLAASAKTALGQILRDSAQRFGTAAAERYALLLPTAMAALGKDPMRAGSLEIPLLPSLRAYPTRLSRRLVSAAMRVRAPPAFMGVSRG